VDALEDRTLPSGVPGLFTTDLLLLGGHHATPFAPPSPAGFGYTPAQIRHAYGFDQIGFLTSSTDPNYYNENAGAGQTIAIVDAYDDPAFVSSTAASYSSSDLAQFDQALGLPDPPSFTKVGQAGSPTNLPGTDPNAALYPYQPDWESEIALDVEWAHAIAPQANLLLVEANSANSSDLYPAVDYAKAHASVVSLSWGGGEYAGETADDLNHFLQSGVTFVVASGDQGAPAGYPAASPQRRLGRWHHAAPGFRRQLPRHRLVGRGRLERQWRRDQPVRGAAELAARDVQQRLPGGHVRQSHEPGRGLRRRPEHRLPGV
jgi:hypothetical protein